MNRRNALALLGFGALAGCGGGGSASPTVASSSSTDVPVGVQQQPVSTTPSSGSGTTATTSTATPSKLIACWGDSITGLYASHLQSAMPDRQIFNGGYPGETSAQINAHVQADTSHRDWLSIFWYGHNDYYKDQVQGNLAASIATLKPGTNFIVMSMLNWASDLPGSATYNSVLQANLLLAQTYPNNFIDIRSMLVGAYNPNLAQDVIDHANDETPTSMRFDLIHLNDAGCDFVAARLRDFILAKGW